MLSREAVEELREIHRRRFGKELTYEEAKEMGARILRLFQILSRRIPKEGKSGDCKRMNRNE